ncbi:alpha/beta hydrolase [Hyalangium versicolor]|uniref:alpha/beta hydrolase n=1 Tax=Hyalangium versicolor TaxID=2861190 RepID=UPI001CCA379D|nr:alpha/beta hydrolase [Hyalangium versicolor]
MSFSTCLRALLASLALALAACASPLLHYQASDIPPLQLAVVGQPPVQDGRARFRTLFCGLAAHEQTPGVDCGKLLVSLAAEPREEDPAPLPPHDPRMRILLVPGGVAECFEDAELFPEAIPRLRALGYSVNTVRVSGRSSSAANAWRIAAAVARTSVPPDGRLVLMGYSKGAADIMEFLVQYPSLVPRVHAVVSIAGSVNGSPAANRYAFVYQALKDWPSKRCPPGDRGIAQDLKREARMKWLARHKLPDSVRYFSVGSMAPEEEVARAMAPLEAPLRYMDPLNDGQLLFSDQLLPGSELLGYVRADHWAVALPLQERWPILAGNSAGAHFPRGLLLEAIVLRMAEALRERPPAREAPGTPSGG